MVCDALRTHSAANFVGGKRLCLVKAPDSRCPPHSAMANMTVIHGAFNEHLHVSFMTKALPDLFVGAHHSNKHSTLLCCMIVPVHLRDKT